MSACVVPQNLMTKKDYACDYCFSTGKLNTLYSVDMHYGIQACEIHEAAANRDMRAWWHRCGLVLIEDVLELCPEIAAIPAKTVTWQDAQKRPRNGGSIPRSSVGCNVFLYNRRGTFLMPVDTHNEYHGHVLVRPAQLQGVSQECIARLNMRLCAGFYKADLGAYADAAEEEWVAELASTDSEVKTAV